MIQKIGEEWELVEESFQRGRVTEGPEVRAMLSAVKGVREALRVMCQVSVTRANFKGAIREALLPILREHAGELFPDVFPGISDIRTELTDLRARLDAVLEGGRRERPESEPGSESEFQAAPPAGEAAGLEVLARLDDFEARIGKLVEMKSEIDACLGDFQGRVSAVGDRVDGLHGHVAGIEGTVEAVKGRIADLEDHLKGAEGRIAQADAKIGSMDGGIARMEAGFARMDGGIADARSRLSALEQAVGDVAFRVTEVDARGAQAHGVLTSLERGLAERIASVEGEVAAVDEHRARDSAEHAARSGSVEAQLRDGLAAAEACLAKVREEVLGAIGRLEASVPETVLKRTGELEASLRRDIDLAAQSLAALVSKVEASIPQVVGQRTGDVEASLRGEIEARVRALLAALARVEGVVPELVDRRTREVEAGLRGEMQSVLDVFTAKLQELRDRVQVFAAELEERHGSELARLERAGEARLREGLERVEGRLDAVRDDLLSLVADIDAAVPETVEKRARELEAKLEKEIAEMLENLSAKLADLREVLGRLEGAVARREAVEGVSERLGRLEDGLGRVEGRVESIDSLTPELRTVGDKLAALRDGLDEGLEGLSQLGETAARREAEAVEAVSERLGRLEDGLGRVEGRVESIDSLTPELGTVGERFAELRERLAGLASGQDAAGKGMDGLNAAFAQAHAQLEGLLRDGIQRWELDQSHTLERLSAIRDSLRDQLRALGDRVEAAQQGGLLGRLRGAAGGVRLSKDDWEHVASKIEGIISGLEAVLARKQRS